jgi:hypothetical protein
MLLMFVAPMAAKCAGLGAFLASVVQNIADKSFDSSDGNRPGGLFKDNAGLIARLHSSCIGSRKLALGGLP